MVRTSKVALITGGSGGIGRTVARELAHKGYRVALVDRSKRELASVLRLIRKGGGDARAVAADVSRPKDVRRAVAGILQSLGRIDVLVNCAGIQAPIGSFAATKLSDWEYNLRVNLFGTVHAAHAVLPSMVRRKEGVIVNFSGGGATGPRPNFSAYAVAKIGVVKFTEILAEELKGTGVRVNAVAPGAVNTGMLKEVLRAGSRAGAKELADAEKRAKEGGTPPERVAGLIAFLASPKARLLTGKLISAVWDPWEKWTRKDIVRIASTDIYTLRRRTE
ncbi:MAG: SDR family oxidoreductase [Candidatus Liptonbacteria bacterium]|nr:SDR family oxidoreductase [Candidatus Liptonbacteria bacterium]